MIYTKQKYAFFLASNPRHVIRMKIPLSECACFHHLHKQNMILKHRHGSIYNTVAIAKICAQLHSVSTCELFARVMFSFKMLNVPHIGIGLECNDPASRNQYLDPPSGVLEEGSKANKQTFAVSQLGKEEFLVNFCFATLCCTILPLLEPETNVRLRPVPEANRVPGIL